MTKDRIFKFLKVTGMKQAEFARQCALSGTFLHFVLYDDRKMSEKTEKRVNEFMDDYIKSVSELATV